MSKEMRKYIDTFKQRLNESENLNISDVRGSKLNIHDFMKQISIEDIKKSIEDNLHYQETGKRLFDRTIQDEIYEQYFSKLGESKSTMMFESYDIICRELSKRWFLGNV